MNNCDIWNEIMNNCGKIFYTKTGLPFIYERNTFDSVRVFREGKAVGLIKKENIEYILRHQNSMVCEIRDNIKERTTTYSLALVKYFNK